MPEQINFTKVSLEALPDAQKGKRDYYLDSNKKSDHLKGFGVVVNDAGKKHFVLTQYFKRDKQTVRLRCGEFPQTTIEQARTKASGYQEKLGAGEHPTEKRQQEARERLQIKANDRFQGVTLQAVLDDYLSTRDLKDSTKLDYVKVIKEVWLDWLDKPLISITDDTVKHRYRQRLKTSKARANYNMRVLRALFNFAAVEYKLPDGSPIFVRNPVAILSEGKEWQKVERRKRYIFREALSDWFKAVDALENQVHKAYFKFLLFTGARRAEAARLLSADVDFRSRVFTLRNTKNGEDVTLPMSNYVHDLLKGLIVDGNEWVFGSPVTGGHIIDTRKQMAKVTQQSGVEFSLHDLRRTFITYAESLDISVYAVKALVNHKSGDKSDVTAGYIGDDLERLRQATQRITNHILQHASDQSAKVVKLKA